MVVSQRWLCLWRARFRRSSFVLSHNSLFPISCPMVSMHASVGGSGPGRYGGRRTQTQLTREKAWATFHTRGRMRTAQPQGEAPHATSIRMASDLFERRLPFLDQNEIRDATHSTAVHVALAPPTLATRLGVVEGLMATEHPRVRTRMGRSRHPRVELGGSSVMAAMGLPRCMYGSRSAPMVGDHIAVARCNVGRNGGCPRVEPPRPDETPPPAVPQTRRETPTGCSSATAHHQRWMARRPAVPRPSQGQMARS